MERKARIVYNTFEDRFDIDIQQEDGTWGLSSGFNCRHCLEEKDNPQKEADFIHYNILNKIKELKEWGYEVNLLGTWI